MYVFRYNECVIFFNKKRKMCLLEKPTWRDKVGCIEPVIIGLFIGLCIVIPVLNLFN